MEEDWDNLIILDACRYDLFEEVNTLQGDLTSVISSDSSTSGFLKYNHGDDYFPDSVYVSANPQVQRHNIDVRFHDKVRLWETSWDDELRTIPPSEVTNAALETQDEYPNKRLIIHFIQPHYPFIGETGQKINHRSVTGDGVVKEEQEISSIWEQLESGAIDKDRVWKAYRENLELALPEVERLLEGLVGKSVITSDHGNSFGEFGVYGHPGGVYINPLVEVPWLIVNSRERKLVKNGKIVSEDDETDTRVYERLSDLGYV